MATKIIASALAVMSLMLTTTATFAQQIPAGYALVPISSLSAQPQHVVNAPTAPAAAYSSLRADTEFAFASTERITLTATLRDNSGRALTDRIVNLISNRATDQIAAIKNTTDRNGEAVFQVVAHEEGVATFTAVDQATGMTIDERLRLVFLKNKSGIGGNEAALLRSDLIAQEGDYTDFVTSYDSFVETDFPSTVTAGEPLDISIGITDSSGNIDTSYLGLVTFESSDPLAILPQGGYFEETEQGQHTFAKAVTFNTTGFHSFTIYAGDDVEPKELFIEVVGERMAADAPTISNPVDGLLTNEFITLTGTSIPSANISIIVDDQPLLDDATDFEGNFYVNLPELDEGEHTIAVAVLDLEGNPASVSDVVAVKIDTTAPELIDFTLDPGAVVAAPAVLTIGLDSEPGLSAVTLFAGEAVLVLEESIEMPGTYLGQINASTPGRYTLSVELTDAVGNRATFDELPELTIEAPLTIIDVYTEPANGQANLSWAPPINHEDVDHYLINYGPISDAPEKTFQTEHNGTAWFIDGLNNDTTYYFSIQSISADGIINGTSEQLTETPAELLGLAAATCDGSATISWKAQADTRITRYQVAYGIQSGVYLETEDVLPSQVSHVIKNLINGVPYYVSIRGLDADGAVIFAPDEETLATPGGAACHAAATPSEYPIQLWEKADKDGQLFLAWNPVPDATGYRVYAGTAPNQFELPTTTVAGTSFRPAGLTLDTPYYFAVKAIREGGHEAATMSNVLQIEVGPPLAVLLALGAAGAGGWLTRRRKEVK